MSSLDDGRELVTQAEIARRFGVSRQRVGQWMHLNDAPRPIPQSPGTPMYWWDAVAKWRADRRIPEIRGREPASNALPDID